MGYDLEFRPVLARSGELLQALGVSVGLTVFAAIVGVALGAFFAAAFFLRIRPAIVVLNIYIEVMRNTPFLVQLFILFFGLPQLGIHPDAYIAALIAMTINLAGYVAEIMRAGVESVPATQVEAGQSLGLSQMQIFSNVILFPAVRNTYPSLCSQIILMFLGSSLCSAISTQELTAVSAQIGSDTFKYFEVYIVVAALYLVSATVMRIVLALIGILAFGRQEAKAFKWSTGLATAGVTT